LVGASTPFATGAIGFVSISGNWLLISISWRSVQQPGPRLAHCCGDNLPAAQMTTLHAALKSIAPTLNFWKRIMN
jgi:hypothetical protein